MKKLKEFLVLISSILIFSGLFIFLTYGIVSPDVINNQPAFTSSIHLFRLLLNDDIFFIAIINTIARPLITSVLSLTIFRIVLKNKLKITRKSFYLTVFSVSFIISVVYLITKKTVLNILENMIFGVWVSILCVFAFWIMELIIDIIKNLRSRGIYNEKE